MRILITDYDFLQVDLELAIFEDAGIEVHTAQCKSESEVIEAGRG